MDMAAAAERWRDLAEKLDDRPRPIGAHWFLAHTHRGAERLVKENFERQGFEAYLPVQVRQNPVTRKIFAVPFFPRYVFVRVNVDTQRWRAIYSTRGVHHVFGSGGEFPSVVPDKVVEQVRAHEEQGLIKMVDPADLPCPYERGERVRVRIVTGGVEQLIDAVFEERVDAKRVAILVSWLGRESRTEAHLAQVSTAAQVR